MVLTDSNYKTLGKGDIAPNFSLKGTDDKTYTLENFKDAKAILIVFMCNHCPYVIPKLPELKRIQKDFQDKGLVVIGINPNNAKDYPDDSFLNMKKIVSEMRFNFLYLRDETQETAKEYGAVCTPDPFLFDCNKRLIYHGRLDDTHGDTPAKEHEMYEIINKYLLENDIPNHEEPSRGCSIKWLYDE